MAVAAETLQIRTEAPEIVSRRTDDIIYNVRYLARHIIDRELGIFEPHAEEDVLEQDVTELAEADVHNLGPIVYQQRDPITGHYISLGGSTLENAHKGCESLGEIDNTNLFEFLRRAEEVIDEQDILEPEVSARMRAGETKVMVSASPTHHEADPDVAISFGYDDRAMLRLQRLSPDGQVKTMQTFSLFNVPAKAWAAFFADRYGAKIEPTALAIMQFCNDQILLESGTTAEILETFVRGVMQYVDPEDQEKIEAQLDGFLNHQNELMDHAEYYAREKLAFQKELALSLNNWAQPSILHMLQAAHPQLNSDDQAALSERLYGPQIYVDDYVAELATKIKTLTNDNRAGLASLNERTVLRVASKIGLEATIELAEREQAIQQMPPEVNDYLVRQNEQTIISSGANCGGACSPEVVDLFSMQAREAMKAGLSGPLYTSSELNRKSKCHCSKAKVISDGKNVVCIHCGEYQSQGKRGNLKKRPA